MSEKREDEEPKPRVRHKAKRKPKPRPKSADTAPRGINWDQASGQWRVRVTWNYTQYTVGKYDSLSLAKAALDLARADIVHRRFVTPKERRALFKAQKEANEAQKFTVAQWIPIWLESLESMDPPRSPGTIASYESTANRHILPSIGQKALMEVTPKDIEDCVSTASQSGKGAARNVARTLRAMFNAAVAAKAGGLQLSPVALKIPKGHSSARQDDEVPSLEEVLALSAAMPADTALAVDLAAWCSLRLGEVLGLQRGDFRNLDKPGKATVTIERQWLSKAKPPAYGPPKDDSHRTVAIPGKLAERIQEHLDQYTAPYEDAPLFPSPRDPGRTISHNAFSARWNVARAKVRPGTDFHALRHFGLTLYAQMGATQTEIMRRGGHKDADVAQRYQHSSLDRDQEIAARLNDRMA